MMSLMFKCKKKRGDYPLPAPLTEAVGLPNPSERATTTPRRYVKRTHSVCCFIPHQGIKTASVCGVYQHTHGRLPLLVFVDGLWEFPTLSVSQEQSAWYTPFPYMVSRNAKGTLSFSFSQRFLCRFRREDNAKIQNFLLPATFTRRFFTKKQPRPLDRAYGIAFPRWLFSVFSHLFLHKCCACAVFLLHLQWNYW